jgi:alpha-L-rhamnosidase
MNTMKLTELKVNQIENPMGYEVQKLSFSWKVENAEEAKKQEYARIIITEANEIVYDSGEDVNANSVDYPVEIALKPRTRYTWSVEVEADNKEVARAESWLETGKGKEPWEANWISTDMERNIHPVMEKKFILDKKCTSARFYCCGLGLYELYINGRRVEEEYLAPGYHSYDFHLQTQTYDVYQYLLEGENQIQVFLGDGWFKGRLGFDGGFTDIYGDSYYFIGELHFVLEENEKHLLVTDESWRCKASPILWSNIYDGEAYDARLESQGEWKPVILKRPENFGELTDRYSLPIVKKESFQAIELIHTPMGQWVLDFGQNLTGWVEFDCDLPEGEKITLTASEILQEGCFYHENMRTAKTQFSYISKGEKAHVRPHFTFYGFRYMMVQSSNPVVKENFVAYHLRSDFNQIGSISTGNAKINQLFSNALWSQKDNFLDVPTDCPQRDERLGWTGDAQIFSETACYNMDMPAFYRKFLWDMRAEQSILDGSVPNVVPRLKRGMVAEHGACPWADAAVIIPWNVYLHYGSKTLLNETYSGMRDWIEYQKRKEEAIGGAHLIKDGFHFGDWLALDNPNPGPFGATDPLFISSAYYYKGSRIVAESAKILDLQEDAEKYAKLADDILLAIQEKYFDKDGMLLHQTQTGLSLTIEFGLMPNKEKEHGEVLQRKIEENNGYLNTGFVGSTILCPALTRTGHHKTAVDLLLNENYPSWLYSVNLGATTIWERWNSVMPDGKMNEEGMNSLNHYSYGSIVAWMYRELCGISPVIDSPGFKRAVISPKPDERLQFVKGEINTAAGKYVSSWKFDEDGRVQYEIMIPFDSTAIVNLKAGSYVVNGNESKGNCFEFISGRYIIRER